MAIKPRKKELPEHEENWKYEEVPVIKEDWKYDSPLVSGGSPNSPPRKSSSRYPVDDSDDYILNILKKLPHKWDKNMKEVKLQFIADKEDSSWIFERIFEEIDRGLISARYGLRKSKHSCELEVTLQTLGQFFENPTVSAVVTAILTALLMELKKRSILSRWKKIREERAAGVA